MPAFAALLDVAAGAAVPLAVEDAALLLELAPAAVELATEDTPDESGRAGIRSALVR